MLFKVYDAESSWYNRETGRIECEQDELMFFGVTSKTDTNLKMELELGYQPSCRTEEIDSILALDA